MNTTFRVPAKSDVTVEPLFMFCIYTTKTKEYILGLSDFITHLKCKALKLQVSTGIVVCKGVYLIPSCPSCMKSFLFPSSKKGNETCSLIHDRSTHTSHQSSFLLLYIFSPNGKTTTVCSHWQFELDKADTYTHH